MSKKSIIDTCRLLSEEYYDLNGVNIEILEEPPTALEFSRLVHISRPVLIRGFVATSELWTNEYLIKKMEQRKISVAVTPDGFADAVTKGPDGRYYFTEPWVEKMTMEELLESLDQGDLKDQLGHLKEVHYLQSQNGNLFKADSEESSNSFSEFEPLRDEVPRDIPWCSDALGQKPDAVNIWIGDGNSATSIHSGNFLDEERQHGLFMCADDQTISDPYENIYTVIRGEKHFTLLPPVDSWCLKEHYYPHASYKRVNSGQLAIMPSDASVPQVRWSSITHPDVANSFPDPVRPIHVTLRAGDTLYLPVGWWHHVRQSGLTISLNWWYDAELRGMTWVLLNLLRNHSHIPSGNNSSAGVD